MFDLIAVGAGAAGVFAAIHAKVAAPEKSVLLLEKSAVLLSKVRISGGGRCNVTSGEFDALALAKNYPRGSQELIGPFKRFGPESTIDWFANEGVALKKEADGRMFPESDSSETIIQALTGAMDRLGVEVRRRTRIEKIERREGFFELALREGSPLQTSALLLATGSSPEGYEFARHLGHTIVDPVPSLFTFNVPHSPLKELSGLTAEQVSVKLVASGLHQEGPLLITHFGFSGPAILKLSAWGARILSEVNYRTPFEINWVVGAQKAPLEMLLEAKVRFPNKTLLALNPFGLPRRLWKALLEMHGNLGGSSLAGLAKKAVENLAYKLQHDLYEMEGKTTHKEEFVTAGGIELKEVSFKTLESKRVKGLYFAGEILDIDGVTGGFNFQNAWTTGFIAGTSIFKIT